MAIQSETIQHETASHSPLFNHLMRCYTDIRLYFLRMNQIEEIGIKLYLVFNRVIPALQIVYDDPPPI